MSVPEIYHFFNKINQDCEKSGEQVVPIIAENVQYYMEQMSNLEFSVEEMIAFEKFLIG